MNRLLSKDDVLALLDPDAVIEAVSGAFAAHSRGATDTPLRASVTAPGGTGVVLAMPCAIHDPAITGTKIVSVFPGNPGRGLPTVASVYVLTDPATGMPLAVMDGTALTAARTAAGSAVATRHLARPDARNLGILTPYIATGYVDTVLTYCRYMLIDTTLHDQLAPLTQAQQIGVINGSPLGMGIITDTPAPFLRDHHDLLAEAERRKGLITHLRKPGAHGFVEAAMRYSLTSDDIAVTLTGAAQPEQLA
ncbi:MAG: hypothetical protein EB107_15075, partial [Proteobacteria bacterium]|nr:hypothetical protein [Pseudomonadota bacterium]